MQDNFSSIYENFIHFFIAFFSLDPPFSPYFLGWPPFEAIFFAWLPPNPTSSPYPLKNEQSLKLE